MPTPFLIARPRFLIDNCLSPKLVKIAHDHGYEACHLRDLKRSDWKDWSLIPYIVEGNWTFVTNNSRDFRGGAAEAGCTGQYARPDAQVHKGLICLNGPAEGMDRAMRRELFEAVFRHLADPAQDPRCDDLACQAVEATITDARQADIEIVRYDLPPGSWGAETTRFRLSRTPPERGPGSA